MKLPWGFVFHRGRPHDWRPVYGDEIIHLGWKRWVCRGCPMTHNNPVTEHPDER